MDEHVVYQPFKITPFDWKVEQDGIRQIDGRQMVTVIIGKKLIKDGAGSILSEEPVKEDIWQETLLGVFTEKSAYRVKVRPGKVPGLFVTYGGEMLPHNDRLEKDMERLISYLETADVSDAVDVMTDGVLNGTMEKRFGRDTQKFVADVNRALQAEYPTELVVEALKHLYLSEKRDLSLPGAAEMRYMTGEGLVLAAGKVLKGRVKGIFDEEYEDALLDELLYRVLSGRLWEKA